MNAIELKSRAQKLTVKVNALGFTKDGNPMVVDQAYELVAAEEGFRNQHALRAQLTAPASNSMQGWIDVVNAQNWNDASEIIHLEGFIVSMGMAAQFAEYARKAASEENGDADDISTEQIAVLKAVGYAIRKSDFGKPYWECNDEASIDFESTEEAWADAWRDVVGATMGHNDLSSDAWDALSATAQLNLVKDLFVEAGDTMKEAIASLELRWGAEHEYYDREDWKQDVSAGDTKLGYWEWVQHNIESNGDEEAHCTKCGCPDADNGEGENGLCGNCADAAYRGTEESADEGDVIDIDDLAETLKLDLDDAKFWVGLHYKVNFDAEPNARQVDWINRYREAHGLTPANSTTSSDADRAAADLAFEEYKFDEHLSVGGVDGWETSSGDSLWTRNVYLEDARKPNEPTRLVKFVAEVNDGTVVNIYVK